MRKPKTHPSDLIVVCDGHKAMILEHEDLSTHELGADRPGRVHQSSGPARSAVAQTDWHELEERDFLSTLAHHLDAAVTRDPGKSVTVVAAPHALGVLRQAYPPALRCAIAGELDKDWIKMPIWQIEERLQQAKPSLH